MKPKKLRTLTLTTLLTTLTLSQLLLTPKAESGETNQSPQNEKDKTTQAENSTQDASGAILSTLEKTLSFPLTLSQRKNILAQYHIYLQSKDKENLYQHLSTLTGLSTQDLQDALKKYL